MDYKKMLIEFCQSAGILVLLVLFMIILTLIMLSLGPQAPPSPKMTCEVVNATTFCHF
jgi:hypothetical protein